MKLLMCLRRVLAGFLLLGLVSCGAEPDFENRYAADAGDILRAETLAEKTVPETVTELGGMERNGIPAAEEPEDIIILPVVEIEPETLPPVVESEPEIMPPVAESEPETLPPVAESEPEIPADSPGTIPIGVTFVCNTNSGKYHLPDCGSVTRIKAENIAYLTCPEAEIPTGYAPCSVCLAASAALQKSQIPAPEPGTVTYILNTNTMKFHAPICSSVKKIKAENYAEFSGTREEAIVSGYAPCGSCKP